MTAVGYFFVLLCSCHVLANGFSFTESDHMREFVREMFHHAYDNYMKYAFPHDELKPISGTYTDSLAELGNAKSKQGKVQYDGVAMTLIDSLSTLAIMGNKTEFARGVRWISQNIEFDLNIRVHLFECNIRLLGGLLSAHALAIDPELNLMPDYFGKLLELAQDLGNRMLRAFEPNYPIPYAWINLKKGVESSETQDTCTAGVGTLLLEFGLLSHYTGDDKYFDAAHTALMKLWSMRSKINLMGNSFDRKTLKWSNDNAGIGAGIDSFYEYLLKGSIYFGNPAYLHMFKQAYAAANRYLKTDHWYAEANMNTGKFSHLQFNSLQAFWPGLQVMYGDIHNASLTQARFFSLWRKYGGLPERYLLSSRDVHSTERYYPLRPEVTLVCA